MIIPEPGVVIAGRYALERPLARGGMGSIWIARHRDLEVEVTVKFMAPALVESVPMRARFEREARVAARLRSQHIVQVHDYGVEDGTPYMVMELLFGESLADRLKREGRLSLPVTARLLTQICKALRTAHEANLVHRDLKPANIFLARKDEEEVVKILDFGIVKTQEGTGDAQADTATGVVLGSVHYMSPEQVRSSRQVDHRSDLWSMGVIVYRVLTGNLPFPGKNNGDVMVRICTDPVQPPTWIVPGLPPELDAFIARALARDETERFQSAQEMAEAFSAMAMGTPQVAPLSTPQAAPQAALQVAPQVASQPAPPPMLQQNKTVPIPPGATPAFPPAGLPPAPPPQSQRAMPLSAGYPPVAPAASETGSRSLGAAALAGSNVEWSSGVAAPAPRSRALWLVGAAVLATAVGVIAVGAVLLGRTSHGGDEELKAGSPSASPSIPTPIAPPPPALSAAPDVVVSPAMGSDTSAPTSSAAPQVSAGASAAPAAGSAPKAPPKPKVTPNPLDRAD